MDSMSSSQPLRAVEPRPMSPSPQHERGPTQPYDYPPHSTSAPSIGLNVSQIPDHPGSMMDVPRPSNNYGQPGPMATSQLPSPTDIKQLKSQCQFNLREYQALQRKRVRPESTTSLELEGRLKGQQNLVLGNLRQLSDEVKVLVREAENHRWRKWMLGGAVASFIPLVRRIFRRNTDQESNESANDTEYAFKRSKGLISYLKDSILGKGSFASMAFFVFAVLYVFQNEVSLRVAKTMQKRVRKLTARIERGDPDVSDKDIKMLDGWRWRVLLW